MRDEEQRSDGSERSNRSGTGCPQWPWNSPGARWNFAVDVDAAEQERQSDWVPTIKESPSEQQGAIWMWMGQDKSLRAREWGERLGEAGALSFSQRMYSLEASWKIWFCESKTGFFFTDVYFYFRDVVSLFLMHLQLAAVPKHSGVCFLYLNWFVHMAHDLFIIIWRYFI